MATTTTEAASAGGWKCARCTFHHHAPGTRCAMCNELRTTKQQMIQFIQGVPITESGAAAVAASSQNSLVGDTKRPAVSHKNIGTISSHISSVGASASSTLNAKVMVNPYQKSRQHQQPSNRSRSGCHNLSQPNSNANTIRTNTTTATVPLKIPTPKKPPASKRKTAPAPALATNPFAMNASKPVAKVRLVYHPGPVPLHPEFSKTWIYPAAAENFPQRQYQVEMSKSACLRNTLVSLPTGLGKTLIAAVVLYNYYRWFPTGKVIFMAPTLPLVNQQVHACYEIMGIPASDTAILTGRVSAERRTIIWKERRVFFCTPQTVQKDLEGARCPAKQVVCVVLDEAHKTTGDYAYVKVVQLLQAAGAKFRILGLSATPGTNILAIQAVVDALRINKIEARNDADPDVAKYIHERQHENVVVKQTSAGKTIERALHTLVGPLLDRLRSSNAIPRISGNATVTAYSLMLAREQFQKTRDGDNSMIGWFLAAQQFVQMRSDLHKHGVGMVRSRMMQLRTERQRGMMATIVKGPEFQQMWEVVAKSTWDPNSTQADVQDKLMNNPKLTKLREILTEHFERARACSQSSRAIVFSQYRGSVSEIVSILASSQPLIRPRHFVGQGKGGTGKADGSGSTTANVKGMKQVEQQQVIREFRDNVHNVLVCTCIGEEGLDIGQVDLIVNFDMLRSPIRMIQRVGRTGRKRDGRVVCLIAEGSEEKTLVDSKRSERTLAHALRNPRSFKVLPTEPMFPTTPTLQELNMQVSQKFHVSQVEGHDNKSTRASNGTRSSKASAKKRLRWRLSEEEQRRVATLGVPGQIPCFATSEFPLSLTRRLFAARRNQSNVALSNGKTKSISTGRSSRILRRIELGYTEVQTSSTTTRTAVRSRSSRRGEESALDLLFPTSSDQTSENAFADKLHRFSVGGPHKVKEATHPVASVSSKSVYSIPIVASERVPLNRGAAHTKTAAPVVVEQIPGIRGPGQVRAPPSNTTTAVVQQPNLPVTRVETTVAQNPYKRPVKSPQMQAGKPGPSNKYRSSASKDSRPTFGSSLLAQDSGGSFRVAAAELEKPSESHPQKQERVEIAVSDATYKGVLTGRFPATASFLLPNQDIGAEMEISRLETHDAAETEDFRLPTQDDSSSSEDDDEGDEGDKAHTRENDTTGAQHMRAPVVAPSNIDAQKSVVDSVNEPNEATNIEEDSFLLPTQESSSEDESTSDEAEKEVSEDDVPLISLKKRADFEQDVPSIYLKKSVSRKSTDSDDVMLVSLKRKKDTRSETETPRVGRHSKTSKHFLSNTDTQSSSAANDGPVHGFSDTPDMPLPHKLKASRRNVLDDDEDDTPEKAASRGDTLVDTPRDALASRASENPLADTPQEEHRMAAPKASVDDIVCAVCLSGDSPDVDPIILCDGHDDSSPCDLAVHTTCYGATVNFDDDQPWRCDPCEFRYNDGRGVLQCGICQGGEAPLRKISISYWKHPGCRSATNQGPARRLRKIQQRKAPTSKPGRSAGHANTSHSRSADTLVETISRQPAQKRMRYLRFMDEEAHIDSGEDMDGDEEDEDDLAAIQEEEEELHGSFINDSSQLGFTQDELVRADADIGQHHDDRIHRTMDLERERMRQFATPVLNRRMVQEKGAWSATQSSGAGSEKGLGNMHFIRSVIEHHRQGGRAEDIERMYEALEEEQGEVDENDLVPERPAPQRTVLHYQSSDED